MDKRSCFSCQHNSICKAANGVREAMKGMPLNIDGDAAPASSVGVLDALGNCCTLYKRIK